MATSNFHNVNATHIFACSIENEWDYEDLIGNVDAELGLVKGYSTYTKSDPHELRSYPSRSICSIERDFNYNDFSLNVIVTPVVRSGYYEGCNLDWHVWYGIDGNEIDIDNIEYELSYNNNLTDIEVKAYSLLVNAKAEELMNEIVTDVEKVFSEYSDKYGVTAQFSNGETIYHKIA